MNCMLVGMRHYSEQYSSRSQQRLRQQGTALVQWANSPPSSLIMRGCCLTGYECMYLVCYLTVYRCT